MVVLMDDGSMYFCDSDSVARGADGIIVVLWSLLLSITRSTFIHNVSSRDVCECHEYHWVEHKYISCE